MTLKNAIHNANHYLFTEKDMEIMKAALNLARKASLSGEVPVAALVVNELGQVISQAINIREKKQTVLGHAELVAIHRASQKLKSWRLINCTLYVTLEPCFMCASALVQARIKRVVFATHDPKGGALGSLENFSKDKRLNHQFEVQAGLFADESSLLLKNFFKQRRKKINSN